jgi:hypothetical protein
MLLYLIYRLFDYSSLDLLVRYINGNAVIRHAFLFSHPNVFAMYVFWETAMYYYLKYDKLKNIDYLLTALLAIYIYIFPNSRTGALVMGILLIITLLTKKNLIKIKYLNWFYIVIVFLSIIGIFAIHNKFIIKIDSLLNTRISLGYIIYNSYGLSLLGADISKGTPMQLVNGKWFSSVKILDSSYYSLLLNYGIVAFIIIVYMILKTIKFYNNNNNENIKKRIMILIWIIYAFCETSCLNPFLGFPLLLISKTIFIKKENKDRKNI